MRNNKRILLINPTLGPEEQYGRMSKAGTELPQLGLAAVAESLINKGFSARIIDAHIHGMSLDGLLELIYKENYGIVGFSVYITTIQNTLFYAEEIKRSFKDITICVGGPQATLTPDAFNKSYIDYVLMGEADYSLAELIKSLEAGNPDPGIKGVLHNRGGLLSGDRSLNLIEDIDSLPLIDLEKYYDTALFYPPVHIRGRRVINLVSSRGCPYKCSFCAAAEVNGRKVRQMSAERFVDYLELYVKKGYDSVMVYDDTFTLNRKRAALISEEILRRNLKVQWNCYSRVDCVDVKLLSLMRQAGCYLIQFGCESYNDKTLALLRKGYPASTNNEGIDAAKEAGLMAVSSFMLGLPRETEEDILHTIEEVCKSRLDMAIFPIFEPFPGTPICEICEQEGVWIKGDFKNSMLTWQEEVWVPDGITRERIEQLAKIAFRRFVFRPQFISNSLRLFFQHLPFDRKLRLVWASMDYFLLSRLTGKGKGNTGSKFK